MASNKNQHYVPRCYLKHFSDDDVGVSISLFNIDREKLIHGAPVKSQCARSYFYGKDLLIEKALQSIEGQYASTISQVSRTGYSLTDDHETFLKRFWLLQFMRTEAASRRAMAMYDEIAGAFGELRLALSEAVNESMKIFYDEMSIMEDLKFCLLRNETRFGFITSDDPAILTNGWYIFKKSSLPFSFGLRSAGNIILLPISPDVLCLGYDGDVYSVPNLKSWVSVRKENDVRSLNEHQFLNCRANVFVRRNSSETRLISEFHRVASHKQISRHDVQYSVIDSIEGDRTRYKIVDKAEIANCNEMLVHLKTIHSRPISWPSLMHWKRGGTVYTNGSAAGYVRKAHVDAVSGTGLRKERA